MTPREQQKRAQQQIGYGPIWLRRDGDAVIVEVEVPAADPSGEPRWVEVIREHIGGCFSHCVEPLGILEQIEGRPGVSDLLKILGEALEANDKESEE
jgi:hypothetical protein